MLKSTRKNLTDFFVIPEKKRFVTKHKKSKNNNKKKCKKSQKKVFFSVRRSLSGEKLFFQLKKLDLKNGHPKTGKRDLYLPPGYINLSKF